ncbi:MAG: helix-turn-helix transcriptional regulator [Altererythrobacter sp.]|nr:helix-turn-helix transcriptional regulator [Altererythrobacter sp.]
MAILDIQLFGALVRTVVPANIYKIFGQRVVAERNSLGLSQDALAQRVGLSRASIANIEAGRQRVLLHQVIALAQALEVRAPGDFFMIDIRPNSRQGPMNEIRFHGSTLTSTEMDSLSRLVESA